MEPMNPDQALAKVEKLQGKIDGINRNGGKVHASLLEELHLAEMDYGMAKDDQGDRHAKE